MQIIKTAGLIFECETDIEVQRATTLLTKEPGTIAWLEQSLRPDDCFWDVGANIGVYSLFAAHRGARVCAFEPHVANARSLLRNVRVNDVQRVTVIISPLGSRAGWLQFFYANDAPGSSGSQLGPAVDEHGHPFQPVACETKWAIRGDRFAKDTGHWPDLIKIDVDGLEPAVLQGLTGIMAERPPRAMQVEIHQKTDEDIVSFMQVFSYALDHRHYTAHGQQALAKGVDPMAIPHNAVFVR